MRLELKPIETPNYNVEQLGIKFDWEVLDIKPKEIMSQASAPEPIPIKQGDYGQPTRIAPIVTRIKSQPLKGRFDYIAGDGEFQFTPYEKPPEVVGGYQMLKRRTRYPRNALNMGIEDSLTVLILVNEKGEIENFNVIKKPTHENMGFWVAIYRAVNSVKWKPAKQRDKAVGVWLAIPFKFRIKDVQF